MLSVHPRADLGQGGFVFSIDVAVADEEGQVGHIARQLELSVPHRPLDFIERLQVQLSNFAVPDLRNNVLTKLHLVEVLNLSVLAVSIDLPW